MSECQFKPWLLICTLSINFNEVVSFFFFNLKLNNSSSFSKQNVSRVCLLISPLPLLTELKIQREVLIFSPWYLVIGCEGMPAQEEVQTRH